MNPSAKLVDNMLRDAKRYLESLTRKAPQDDALALAQQRAALPVEQGGLGLGPNNTPMERADIMFPEEGWHGTTRDFTEFKERGRVPIYASDRPEIANIYAELGDRGKDTGMPPNAGPNVIPLRIGGRALEVSDIVGGQHGWLKDNLEEVLGQFPQHTSLKDKLASGGYDRLRATGMSDLGDPMQIQHMVPEAKNLRSRFAAFDPFRRNESDLLAALGPYAVPAAVAGLAGASMTPSEAEAGVPKFRPTFKAPQDDALRLAQQRAALPVSEGGLGLPANNTPMERADIMFPGEGVHFSRHGKDVSVLDSGVFAISPFDAVGTHIGSPEAALDRFKTTVGYKVDNPNYANDQLTGINYPVRYNNDREFTDAGVPWDEFKLSQRLREMGGYDNIEPSDYRAQNVELRKEIFGGSDAIPYINDVESPGSVSHIVPPANIRSRFASFDPFRRHESDLLAALGPYAVPAAVAGLAGASMTPSEAEAGIAGALAKTADKDMLKLAKQAEAGGLPMHKVYDATGWAKGADGKWRFEFDDQVTFNRQGDPGFERLRGPLFDKKLRGRFEQGAVNSPTWQAAYPNMKDINVYWRDEPGWPEGAVKGSHMAKHVDPNGRSVPESIIGQSNDSYKSVVHEMQHGAQNREGFEKGGSPSEFMDGATTPEEAHNNYLTLAGEVEARNVQNRMGWDADRRRMQPFFETEDTPRYLQIVRGAASSLSPSYAEASIRRGLRKSDREAMTHYAPKPMSAGGKAARDMAVEMMNPASWPLLWGSRELGRPEDLKFTNGAWSSR